MHVRRAVCGLLSVVRPSRATVRDGQHKHPWATEKEGRVMALARWNPTMPWRPSQEPWTPFEGMESLRAGMDHLFNTVLGTLPPSGGHESLWYPRVDLLEHEQEFVLMADLPGMQQDDIHITVENNWL